MRQARAYQRRNAITLIETLVVVAVLGFLISLSGAAIQMVREAANRAACQANLRQIGIGMAMFHDDHGFLPPTVVWQASTRGSPFEYFPWQTNLLPYLGEEPAWRQAVAALRETKNTLQLPPHSGRTHVVRLYQCATDSRVRQTQLCPDGVEWALSSYLGVKGSFFGTLESNQGMLVPQSFIRYADALDGLSNTVVVGERPPPDTFQAGGWYTVQGSASWTTPHGPSATLEVVSSPMHDPSCAGPTRYGPGRTDNPCDRWHFWSLHPRGGNWLFADGSARFLSYSAEKVLPDLATRAGGEFVEIPD